MGRNDSTYTVKGLSFQRKTVCIYIWHHLMYVACHGVHARLILSQKKQDKFVHAHAQFPRQRHQASNSVLRDILKDTSGAGLEPNTLVDKELVTLTSTCLLTYCPFGSISSSTVGLFTWAPAWHDTHTHNQWPTLLHKH
jgi:hypothetical protein